MNPQVFISAGELRNRVCIQTETTAIGPTGAPTSAGWDTIRETWAGIATIGQKDNYQADQFSADVTHTITVRYTPAPAIFPGMRVQFVEQNGTVHQYLIQAVDNVMQRNVKVNLMCLEINGSQ